MVDIWPVILVDTREQVPLVFDRRFRIERATLAVGDYGVRGFSGWENPAFIVERKSLEDLCQSLGAGRERFLREVERMRQFRFRALIIEGMREEVTAGEYRSEITPAAVLATLDALAVRSGLHVFWCGDAAGAARQVESLARQFVRGVVRDAERLGLRILGAGEVG
ncbi:MAG: ERCC4 domain-containing protein [Pseudomonadota bacterium]